MSGCSIIYFARTNDREQSQVFGIQEHDRFAHASFRVLPGAKDNSPTTLRIAELCLYCAPGGTRTPNDGSEDRCDIHFTTGAL